MTDDTQPLPPDAADSTSPGYPWNEQYIRIYFRTMEKRGPSRRRIIGAYQRTLEAAVKAITDRYPSAVFESAKIAQGEINARTARRVNLTLDGKVSSQEPEDEEFAEGGEEETLPSTPPEPSPRDELLLEPYGRIRPVDARALYNKSYDEEATHTPGEGDHVRLQRATLTMLRALYLQNEEITAAVTHTPDTAGWDKSGGFPPGVDEPNEPEDFDAHRCAAFEGVSSPPRRCVLLDYHEGFPSTGHQYDARTACVCGAQIWSKTCRGNAHTHGAIPLKYVADQHRCVYRNEREARCVKPFHHDPNHSFIKWENSDAR